jgi:hypothetical protein
VQAADVAGFSRLSAAADEIGTLLAARRAMDEPKPQESIVGQSSVRRSRKSTMGDLWPGNQ